MQEKLSFLLILREEEKVVEGEEEAGEVVVEVAVDVLPEAEEKEKVLKTQRKCRQERMIQEKNSLTARHYIGVENVVNG